MNQQDDRECNMTACVGSQGAGKTRYNQYLIRDYCTDNLSTRVKGRKCLILDSNGEFSDSQWIKNGINNFKAKTLALKDIPAFSSPKHPIECRRVDMKHLGISQKLEVLTYAINNFKNGLLVGEDLNGYVLNLTHLEEIIGRMVSLRHRGLDVILSFQRLRAINPVIYGNSRYIRYHHQLDNVFTVGNKISNPELFKIAQLIENNRYESGDIYFYLFINQLGNKIEGEFTQEEFDHACKQYLNIQQKELKEYMRMHKVNEDEGYRGYTEILRKRYLVQS